MKFIFVCLLFTGCAFTEVSDPKTGKRVFYTQADATNITYTGPGYSFHADRLNHSTPTRAGGSVAGTISSGFVSGVTALRMPIK